MRRRTHPIAQFIFVVAAIVLIGDLSTVQWKTIGEIGLESGVDYPFAFLAMFFAQTRNALVMATILIGLGAIVDLLARNLSKT